MAWTFHNLNIKHPHYAAKCPDAPHSAARYWLETRQQAPIFFYDFPVARIRNNDFEKSGWVTHHQTQMRSFVGLEKRNDRAILITVDAGWVWIYEVLGKCKMATEDEIYRSGDEIEHPKVFDIRMLKKVHVKEEPLVLSSMKSNQFLVRGTFNQVYPREGGT